MSELPADFRIIDPHIHMVSRTTDDYEAMAAAPTYTSGVTVGEGYSRMAFTTPPGISMTFGCPPPVVGSISRIV